MIVWRVMIVGRCSVRAAARVGSSLGKSRPQYTPLSVMARPHVMARGSSGPMSWPGAQVAPCHGQGLRWPHVMVRGSSGPMSWPGAQVAPYYGQWLKWPHVMARGSIGPYAVNSEPGIFRALLGIKLSQAQINQVENQSSRAKLAMELSPPRKN